MPSTMPCNPAPGRRLLIVRTDTQVASGGSFLAFDGMIPHHPTTSNGNANLTYKRHTTLSPVVELDSRPTSSASEDADNETERGGGLRGFLRSVMGGSKARSKSRGPSRAATRLSVASLPASVPSTPSPAPLTRSATDDPRAPHSRTADALAGGQGAIPLPPPRHRNLSFKFSLEFHTKHHALGPMRLVPPRLPMAAHAFIQSQGSEMVSQRHMTRPVQPLGKARAQAKYAGRALAEWTVVVMECQSFFDRRKNEGVPANKFVETPQLAVEVITKKPI